MNWLDSKTIKYLALTWAASIIVQLVPMLQAHKIDWWALGTQTAVVFAGILTRMAQGDVVAPPAINAASFGLLNRNNPTPPPAPDPKDGTK